MTIMDKKINKLMKILEKENWKAIEIETVGGSVSVKFVLHKPKYKFLKTTEMIQFYDRITDKKILIDIYCATEIVINEEKQEYEIELYHEEYVKMKMY